MSWRSVVIAHPARLSYQQRALVVAQDHEPVRVPLEDMAALILDHNQITLTAPLLSACAAAGIAVITVDDTHTPNGALLPYLPHSRALKVMRAQLALGRPLQKRLWQGIVRQKLANQAAVLRWRGADETAARVARLARQARSGDPDNVEGQAAQCYFPALFGAEFTRGQARFYNGALNYGYAIVRSAVARALVAHGFLPAFGLQHANEQNAFNLADDLLEPYRPLVDAWVLRHYAAEPDSALTPTVKATLVGVLHQDAPRCQGDSVLGRSTVLALAEATVISLAQRVQGVDQPLVLPGLPGEPGAEAEMDEPGD